MSVIPLGDRLKVVRTPKDIRKERINDAIANVHSKNQDGLLKAVLIIGVADGGKHMLVQAGDPETPAIDMVGLLELMKQTILLSEPHDQERSPTTRPHAV